MAMESIQGELGRYYLQGVIGQSSRSFVYRALAWESGELVALKLFDPEIADAPFVAAVTERVELVRGVTHPAVLRLRGVETAVQPGSDQPYTFVVSDYLPGGSLLAYLNGRRERLSPTVAVQLARQLASGLAALHAENIIHQDMKPSNILLRSATDEVAQLVIADFGLAVRAGTALASTSSGLGSLAYISPERLQEQPTDGRSDLYALGIISYLLLTGELPYQIDSFPDVQQHLFGSYTPPSQMRDGLPEAADALVARCMAREPDNRFANASELGKALDELLTLLEERPLGGDGDDNTPPPPLTESRTVHEQEGYAPAVNISDRVDELETWPGGKGEFRLVVAHQYEKSISYSLEKPYIKIGRIKSEEFDNDIVLQDQHISREHLVLERHNKLSNPIWKVRDLSSTNGFYINGERKERQQLHDWEANQPLRVGPYFLQWQSLRQVQGEAPEPDTADEAGIEAELITLSVEMAEEALAPGETAEVKATVKNDSDRVTHFELVLQDGGAPVTIVGERQQLELGKGQQKTVTFAVQAKAGSLAQAGEYGKAAVLLFAGNAEKAFKQQPLPLTIAPFKKFELDVHPTKLNNKERTRVTLSNNGNLSQKFTIVSRDAGDELLFSPNNRTVAVGPGQRLVTEVEIRARDGKRPWIQSKDIPFTLEATSPDAEVKAASGAVHLRPRIPWWLPLLLIAIGVGIYFLFSWLQERNQQRLDQAQLDALNAQATVEFLEDDISNLEATATRASIDGNDEISAEFAILLTVRAEEQQDANATISASMFDATAIASITPKVTPSNNAEPTDISLSNNSIEENNAPNDQIGTFSTTDPNPEDNHTYQLVSGEGGNDNALFLINGNELLAAESFDYENKQSLSILIRSTDSNNSFIERIFTIQVQDVDDNPKISLNTDNISVSEESGEAIIEIELDVPPTQQLTLNFTVENGTATRDEDFRVSGQPIQWEAGETDPKRISVTLLDDQIYEKSETFRLIFKDPEKASLPNNGQTYPVTITITEEEKEPKLSIKRSEGVNSMITEADESDTNEIIFTVDLEGLSAFPITVTVNLNLQAGDSVSPTQLTWSTNNNDSQDVTVIIAGNDIDNETNRKITATLQNQINAQISTRTAEVEIIDNDNVGILINGQAVNEITLNVAEQDNEDFTLEITSKPRTSQSPLTISLDFSQGESLCTLSNANPMFSEKGEKVTITVTANQNDIDFEPDSKQDCIVSLKPTGSPEYETILGKSIKVSIADNDNARIVIDDEVSITEQDIGNDATATYTVKLNSRPAESPVIITISPDYEQEPTSCGMNDFNISQETITFETDNSDWENGKTITIRIIGDNDAETNQTGCNIIHSIELGSSPEYEGLEDTIFEFTLIDDDTPQILLSPQNNAIPITEINDTVVDDTYQIVLSARPSQEQVDIRLELLSNEDSDCSGVSITPRLTYTFFRGMEGPGPQNWEIPKNITINLQGDDVANGIRNCQIAHAVTNSANPEYQGVMTTLTIVIADDDVLGIYFIDSLSNTITMLPNIIEEEATGESFRVRLNSQPIEDVTIELNADISGSTGNGCPITLMQVDDASITIPQADWNTGVEVTVVAVQDDNAVDEMCTISIGSVSGGEGDYNEFTSSSTLDFSIVDNEEREILFTDTTDNTVITTLLDVLEENTNGRSFRIRLSSQPTENVTIELNADISGSTGNGCPITLMQVDDASSNPPASITIPQADWNTGVEVTVVAVQDDNAVDEMCTIGIGSVSGGDYDDSSNNNIDTSSDLTFSVLDNDVISIFSDESPLTIPVGESRNFTLQILAASAPNTMPIVNFNEVMNCSLGNPIQNGSFTITGVGDFQIPINAEGEAGTMCEISVLSITFNNSAVDPRFEAIDVSAIGEIEVEISEP